MDAPSLTTTDHSIEQRLRRRLESLERMLEAAQSLSLEFEFDNILQSLVHKVRHVFNCEAAHWLQYDSKSNELFGIVGHSGVRFEMRDQATSGIAGHVAQTRQIANIKNPATHSAWSELLDRPENCETQNILAIALASPCDNTLFGVLLLHNKHAGEFDKHDENLLLKLAKQTEVALERARIMHDFRRQHELDPSLRVAREIQRRFMPEHMPKLPGYEVATWWLPNETVGGDYCDVLHLTANRLGLCVADVSGHGLGPSLLMASVRAALHALMLEHSCPQVLLEMVGKSLWRDLHATGFVTMVLGSLDLQAHTFEFSNAGHAPAMHYKAAQKQFIALEATGVPLGVIDAANYPLGPRVELHSGDWVILCTDGIVEAIDGRGEQFGYERLQHLIQRYSHYSAKELVCQIGAEVEQYYLEDHPQDDLTILALKRLET